MSLQHLNADSYSGAFPGRCLRRLRGSGGFIRTVLTFVALALLPAAGLLVIWAAFDLVFARHPTTEIANGVIQSGGLLVFFSLYVAAIGVLVTLVTRLADHLSPSRGIARGVASVTSLLLSGYLFLRVTWLSNMQLGVFVFLVALSVFAAYAVIPSNRNA